MAFMGIIMVYAAIILAVLALCTVIGTSLLVFSIYTKKKYKAKLAQNLKPKKRYLVIRLVGIVFLLPPICAMVFFVYSAIRENVEKENYYRTSLCYAVMEGDLEQAEKLLKNGVSPDCTVDSNETAQNGEETLLCVLAGSGFEDTDTDEEIEMMKLLIEYGADIEYRAYEHTQDYMWHYWQEENDVYKGDDGCGYTPLLYSVKYGEYEKAKLLLEAGADVNVTDYCGFNAVAVLAEELSDDRGVDLLKLLLDEGCRDNSVTNFRQNTLFLVNHGSDNEQIHLMIEEANGITRE